MDIEKSGGLECIYDEGGGFGERCINTKESCELSAEDATGEVPAEGADPSDPKATVDEAAAAPGGAGVRVTEANKERYISKMFLRGDSVILVLRNPNLGA